MSRYIAHITRSGEKQPIEEHCKNVAALAFSFSKSFQLSKSAYFTGLFHDIGKYSGAFQRHILAEGPTIDHSSAGAKEIYSSPLPFCEKLMISEAIASHHSGLLNIGSKVVREDGTLYGRLGKNIEDYSAWKQEIPYSVPFFNELINKSGNSSYQCLTLSFMTRMLFSSLVDADFLDTEAFMQGKPRKTDYEGIPELCNKLMEWLDSKGWRKNSEGLAGARSAILNACISRGTEDKGLYTLTVPTGGGKTVSSLAFALNHAQIRGMSRVIYVIPYCSIIDQTLDIFTSILGSENVLGHYSEMDYSDNPSDEENQKMLSTENWDCPIIVTTAVQFFESLYSCKTSKCRKLHNIANSVIIFDEAQTFPIPYLDCVVAAISELVTNCQCTCVLCTATQPALEGKFKKYSPILTIKELCPEAQKYSSVFKRVNYKDLGTKQDEELLPLLRKCNQVLCIVNTVRHAYDLYQSLKGDGIFCLTTNILPIDRIRILNEIRRRLKDNGKCILIATSLIEAGVDIDFPVVYRGYSGIDSMIQAGGRCNREGKRSLSESYVYLFGEDEKYRMPDSMERPKQLAKGFLKHDITTDKIEKEYFRQLFYASNCDSHGIIELLNKRNMEFATAADKFKLIEDNSWTLYVPVDETSASLLDTYENHPEYLTRQDYRKLGKYSLRLFDTRMEKLEGSVSVLDPDSKIAILTDTELYSRDCGLSFQNSHGDGIFL